MIQKRGAGIRHTPHGSPQATPKYGNAAPVDGCSPNIKSLLILGGDSEVIEQYVLHSVLNARAKLAKRMEMNKRIEEKVEKSFHVVCEASRKDGRG